MLPLVSIASAGATLFAVKEATGVVGFDDWTGALVRLAPKIATRARRRDSDALDEMVALARSRVKVDTGRLLNGITGETIDDGAAREFRASAVHDDRPKPGEDYVHFVEFGTSGGVAGEFHEVATESYFATSPTLRRRRSLRTHPGTPPSPFFYVSADEVLAKRNVDMADICPEVAGADGWEIA